MAGNGFDYRDLAIQTPYLWSMAAAARPGKFVRDDVFDPTVAEEEPGCVAGLKALVKMSAVIL